ncbi:hypothetical protein ACNOYE_10505 [Nannocystaceae bacterium ST9]
MHFVLARVAFAALLLFAPSEPPARSFAAEGLDAAALESGLRVRVGEVIDQWGIEILATELRGTYAIELRPPGDRAPERRVVSLVGETDEDRSRELAATLALILLEEGEGEPEFVEPELIEPEPVEPEPESAAIELPRATLSLEGHFGVGPPSAPDPDYGVGLGAGAWLVRDHLQPRVRARWAHSSGDNLRVDGFGIGAGLAGGLPWRRWWFGVLALPTFKWTRGFDRKPSTALSGGGELSAMVQYRRPWLVVGLRTGIETTFRPVLVRGSNDVIRWGPVRWLLVLELGLGLGRTTKR